MQRNSLIKVLTMCASAFLLALAASAALATTATAQSTSGATPTQGIQPLSTATSLTPNRDVILEVPELSVDSIGLTVSDLHAHVSLDANAMNFVTVNAGVDVGIKQVQLGIVGVLGEVYLYVDLDNVAKIVNRVVQTLDRNPQILTQVLKTVDTAVTSVTAPPK